MDTLYADVVDLNGQLHVHGVENITLYSGTGSAGANSVDAGDITGATSLTVSDLQAADATDLSAVTADLSLTNLAAGVSVAGRDFHHALSISLAADTGADVQNIALQAFSAALTTTNIETVNLTVSEPSDGAATDVDMSAASGVQHLVLSGSSGTLNLHLPGGDLAFQDLNARLVHILDTGLSSLSLKLDNSAAWLQTDSSLSSLSLDTTGSAGPCSLEMSLSGASSVSVTGTQALGLYVHNQNVDAHTMSADLLADAGGSSTAVNLTGGTGNDSLDGGDGNDRLDGGGGGTDRLAGNSGADIFVFDHAPTGSNVSTITDLATGTDQLELDHSAFAGLNWSGAPHTLAAGEFFQGDPNAISGQHVIFEQGSGNLYYDADGMAGGAQLFATVGAGSDVHNSDIHIV